MIDYNPAKKEIIAAKKCLEQMKSSTNHDDFEMHWRECLGHIEKSFSKLLCATKPVSGKFSSHFIIPLWKSQNLNLLILLLGHFREQEAIILKS